MFVPIWESLFVVHGLFAMVGFVPVGARDLEELTRFDVDYKRSSIFSRSCSRGPIQIVRDLVIGNRAGGPPPLDELEDRGASWAPPSHSHPVWSLSISVFNVVSSS